MSIKSVRGAVMVSPPPVPKTFPKVMRHRSTDSIWLRQGPSAGVLLSSNNERAGRYSGSLDQSAGAWEDYNEPVAIQNE